MDSALSPGSLKTLRLCLGLLPPEDTTEIEEHLASKFGISSPMYQDAVFISVDTEGNPAREIGISTPDTRDLKGALSPSEVQMETIISTYNYQLKRHERAECECHFQFGTSQMIDARCLSQLLQKILRTGHPNSSYQEPRNTILVGHSLDGDLEGCNWSLQDQPPVLVFDTQPLRRARFGGSPRNTLNKLVKKLRIPHKYLHNGGNDSNSTLKALLQLAVLDCPSKGNWAFEFHKRKQVIRAIAQMTLPPPIINHLEPIPFVDDLVSSTIQPGVMRREWRISRIKLKSGFKYFSYLTKEVRDKMWKLARIWKSLIFHKLSALQLLSMVKNAWAPCG